MHTKRTLGAVSRWMIGGLTALFLGSGLAYATDGDVSDATKVAEAKAGQERLEGLISTMQNDLETSRQAGDVAKMDCYNSLLVNARGFLSVVQNAKANLEDAIARNDAEAVKHHYKLVQLGISKGDDIAVRSRECTTGVLGVSGTTVQNTQRVCTVQPCLGGEEYYDATKSKKIGEKDGRDTVSESSGDVDVDASAFF